MYQTQKHQYIGMETRLTKLCKWQFRLVAIGLNILCKLYFRSSDLQSGVIYERSKFENHSTSEIICDN